MAARPWNADDDTQLRQLHAAGKSLGEAATLMGKAKATVSTWSKRMDPPLIWDRAATATATQAKVADAKAKRAQLELDYLDDAQRLRQQVWQQHEYIDHGGKDFKRVTWTQDQPSPIDKLKLMQASTMAAAQSLRIAVHDTEPTKDMPAVDQWLAHMTGTIERIGGPPNVAPSEGPSDSPS